MAIQFSKNHSLVQEEDRHHPEPTDVRPSLCAATWGPIARLFQS